jgi:5-formyltetrahydrofolate cyclo-ligase
MDKPAVRARVRAARRARSETERRRTAESLAGQVLSLLPDTPTEVTAYRSLPTEPGTSAIMDVLAETGHRVWLPRIEGSDLVWVRIDAATGFRPGPMGIEEPDAAGQRAFPAVALALLPGLAADPRGWRLGQGGGFYDRALAEVPAHADGGPLRVLLLHDDEVLEHVPREPHDCRVDVIVTPSGVIRTTG